MSWRVLDLFCGAGGAATGLKRAWRDADIIGVDRVNQPRYPFRFRMADALTYPVEGFDFIWASPPCQKFSSMRFMKNARFGHEDLISPIRERLEGYGVPFVIENVFGAPLKPPVVKLCGTSFGLGVKNKDAENRRHRFFEVRGFYCLAPPCAHTKEVIGVYGHGFAHDRRATNGGSRRFSARESAEAMGIDWMTRDELAQAVPPVYAEFIARQVRR